MSSTSRHAATAPGVVPVADAPERRLRPLRWSQETIAILAIGVPILLAVLGVLWNTFNLDGRITREVDRLEATQTDIRRTMREEHIEMRREHAEMRREHAEIRQALRDHANR